MMSTPAAMAPSKVPFGKAVLCRLTPFVTQRAKSRPDLHPGRFWVWDSFRHHLPRIATLVVLSNLQAPGVESRKQSESLLDSITSFAPMGDRHSTDEPYYGDLDGCYLHFDVNRLEARRAGQTTAGFAERNKQHLAKSKLRSVDDRMKPFYSTYPHPTAEDKPLEPDGTWNDLMQLVGIGMEYDKREKIVELFDWPDSDIKHLNKLKKGARNNDDLVSKQYRHLCYMFETFFALAIARNRNLSSSPGCEWQTGYHGEL
jgi:hypothetical protein